MKKIVRLNENDLTKLVKKVINESRDLPNLDDHRLDHRLVELIQEIKKYEEERKNGDYEKLGEIMPKVKFRVRNLQSELDKIKEKLKM